MVTSPVQVTYEESLRRPESSLEEVVDGELRLMPPATFYHNRIVRTIAKRLMETLDPKLATVWDAGFLIAERPRLRYRIPDLAIADIAALQALADRREVYARFAPVSVIEVLSPANRKGDTGQLLRDYRDLGVPEIVFIDPESRAIQVNGKAIVTDRFTIAGIPFDLSSLL